MLFEHSLLYNVNVCCSSSIYLYSAEVNCRQLMNLRSLCHKENTMRVWEITQIEMWNKNATKCSINVAEKAAKLFSFTLRLSVAFNIDSDLNSHI